MASAYLKYVRPYQKEQAHSSRTRLVGGCVANRRRSSLPPSSRQHVRRTGTSRFGPTHRRAFRVASGPIVARSAFMLQHLFVSERPSPSARERVHLEDFGSTDLMKSHDSRHVSLLLRVIRRQTILRDSSGRGKPGDAPYTLGSWA